MSINNKHIDTILNAVDEDSLAIFVGAGVSKSSENEIIKLPSWGDLIEELKTELNIDYEVDYLKVAQLYFLEFGEHLYYKKIKSFFPSDIPPSKIHKLIFEVNPHVVITTNWDCILESVIRDNAYIYGLVASDKDLMKSSLDKKLIKMHGDFSNHNIVFKEDDYINYEFNFPLISNYIKSILSTHTVLFLGYSYNDFDIKQIIKWTQNHSNVRPPMFLVVFKADPAQSKYLLSHGITTIVLDDKSAVDHFNNYYTSQLYNFLLLIKNKNISNVSPNNIIKQVHNRLLPLNTLEGILAEQVIKSLTNCGLIYTNTDGKPRAFLYFYTKEVTIDFNESLRSIYSQFVMVVKNNDEKENKSITNKLEPIFNILKKADISGIIIDEKKENAVVFSESNDSELNNIHFDFNYEKEFDYTRKGRSSINLTYDRIDPYVFYQNGHNELAYMASEDLISYDLKLKNYASLLLTLFNQNVILHQLKYGFSTNDKYNEIESNNILEIFEGFPRKIRRSVSMVLELVNFNYLFNFNYTIDSLLVKAKDRKNSNSLFSWDSEEFKPEFLHMNLVNFVMKNGFLIDVYKEFRYAINKFIQIIITKQKKEDRITLKKEELFSCIKYIEIKKLREYFKNIRNRSYLSLDVCDDDARWLVDRVFINLTESYITDNKFYSKSDDYIVKLLFLISNSKEIENHKSIVYDKVIKLLSHNANSIQLIEAIDDFITLGFNRLLLEYNKDFVEEVVILIVAKLAEGRINGSERIAFITKGVQNIFLVAKELKITYKDKDMAKALVMQLSNMKDDDKARSVETIIYELHLIANAPVKNILVEYVKSIPLSKLNPNKKLRLGLFLMASGIAPADSALAKDAENSMGQFSKYKYSTEALAYEDVLRFLVEKKGMKDYLPALSKIESITKKFEIS
ncbi:TPA: SIR2 family protein [Klebsiella oxytoca]|uniref:SIR2 family protein n=1 Tax=Klebsiella oxytoca TaxID=571 RepID=UPI00288DDE90|nr:SIR2 family protein [Klebsiella oxytoca]WPI52623.1 SIR2 family protein [Klebsiella oxytoca]HDX9021743.1 SIR2 family protein [Klebsiella oxytoca]